MNWRITRRGWLQAAYHSVYHPAGWRAFWGLGSGNFGDMACHILDAPYWGLNLRYPISVQAEGPLPYLHVAPKRMRIEYQFERPAGGPPLDVVWYDGQLSPPKSPVEGRELPNEGALVIGEQGQLLHNILSRVLASIGR